MQLLRLFLLVILACLAVAQELPPPNTLPPDRHRPGPWDNDVLVYRLAPGGELEKLAMFERAGVPTVARMIGRCETHESNLFLPHPVGVSSGLLVRSGCVKAQRPLHPRRRPRLGDTTLYGHTKFYQTPNLERLAKRGMTFTRAYSASPLCSPTRSAILTGLSPARTGITTPNCHVPQVVLEATPGKSAAPDQKSIQPDAAHALEDRIPHAGRVAEGSRLRHRALRQVAPRARSRIRPCSRASMSMCRIIPARARPEATSRRGNSRTSMPTPPCPTSTSRTAWRKKPWPGWRSTRTGPST